MRFRHHIKDHNKPEFTAALDKMGIRYKTKLIEGTGQTDAWDCFDLFVYDDDPRWPALRDLALEHNVMVFHGPAFTPNDIEAAPWLLASATADAGYPQPEARFEYEAESFDLRHWCRRCGIGKVQTHPIRLKAEPKNKTAHFLAPQWLHQVLFVRPEVRDVFEAEGVSGAQYLAPVMHRTGAPLMSLVQIVPTETAPDGMVGVVQEQVTCSPHDDELSRIRIPSERGDSSSGGFCERIKYHVPGKRRIVHYSRGVFEGAPDIVLSAEWFGTGAAASQHIIVSNKVARLVLAHKWKGLELEPIQLV